MAKKQKKKKVTREEVYATLLACMQDIDDTKNAAEKYAKVEKVQSFVAREKGAVDAKASNAAALFGISLSVPVGTAVALAGVAAFPLGAGMAMLALSGSFMGGMVGMNWAEKKFKDLRLQKDSNWLAELENLDDKLIAVKDDILQNRIHEIAKDPRADKLLESSPVLMEHFAKAFANNKGQLPDISPPVDKPKKGPDLLF